MQLGVIVHDFQFSTQLLQWKMSEPPNAFINITSIDSTLLLYVLDHTLVTWQVCTLKGNNQII